MLTFDNGAGEAGEAGEAGDVFSHTPKYWRFSATKFCQLNKN